MGFCWGACLCRTRRLSWFGHQSSFVVPCGLTGSPISLAPSGMAVLPLSLVFVEHLTGAPSSPELAATQALHAGSPKEAENLARRAPGQVHRRRLEVRRVITLDMFVRQGVR